MANATNTQLPPHFNFVSSPSSRGTMEILWSSLFTIFACTWTVQHPNVPEQRAACKPGWRGSLKWHTKRFYTGAKWMMVTMIAPELVIGQACYELLAAKTILRDLQLFASEDDVPWTLTHSYYANMGGFVIQSGIQEPLHAVAYIPLEDVSPSRRSNRLTRPQSWPSSGSTYPKDCNSIIESLCLQCSIEMKRKPLLTIYITLLEDKSGNFGKTAFSRGSLISARRNC